MAQAETMSVTDKLKELEKIYNINILFAVETGDRAFGLNVPEALSTVRFIFKHPIEQYLKFTSKYETIEWVDDDIELYGIDLRKAINMITESNRNIYEWTNSSVKYLDKDFGHRLNPILEQYFSTEVILPQYQTVIHNQLEGFLDGKATIRECLMLDKTCLQIKYILKMHQMSPTNINELITATKFYTTANDKREINHLIHEMNLGHGYKPYILGNTLGLNIKTEYEAFLSQIDYTTKRKVDLSVADNFFLREIGILKTA